jgi:pimeloyl-ACP methyl ester carboxylesterase
MLRLARTCSRLAAATFLGLALSGCATFHGGALPGAPASAKFANVAGARVHYVDEGPTGADRPTVVFIHGFASSLGTWKAMVPKLATDRRVIALDLKGFGWTDRPEGDYSPAAQASLVWALLKERGVDGPVALVAHSWGSSIALAMTLEKPDRVERIALYDAWVYDEQLPTFFYVARAPGVGEALVSAFYEERPDDKIAQAFHDERYVTEELVENVEAQLSRPGTREAALAAIRAMRYDEVQDRYRKIDKPVLLLWGREDRVTKLEFGERLSRELPDARLVVYPGCGHFPMIEAAVPSTRDLIAFLRAAPAPDAAPAKDPAGPSAGAPPPAGAPERAPKDGAVAPDEAPPRPAKDAPPPSPPPAVAP